jgi:alpha-amylase/alpha-mannosidase (GH57 family)
MTQLALLWHMHQPYYEDLVTREHILPWVRLHAIKDYYGMVALLREFPDVRMTFNLVPSLLIQLEAFASNRAYDRTLDVGLKPALDLTPHDAVFMLENFFHAHRHQMIERYPRYAELLELRGPMAGEGESQAAARRFGVDDLRDLQVWQKLAWIDPLYLDADVRIGRLLEKQRHFGEDDKHVLRAVELEILNAVIPEYRAAAGRGQIEISASPCYHPILPLLCDTDVYKRTHPHSAMPRSRFVHPEDAMEQLRRAVVLHERLFGASPRGLWPSEGSVSDAMAPLVSRAGFRWMATDEEILGRTIDVGFTRDDRGHLNEAELLYRPYLLTTGGERVSMLFRDHALSDLIGFTYAGWSAEAAAADFVSRVVEAGRRFASRTAGGEAVVPVILDGENAWEHFEGGGRPFLRALYRHLAANREIRTVTMGEACAREGRELSTIFPGSWIDANFYIWIGHPDDHRAWGQLADARDTVAAAVGAPPDVLARAREEVFIAEGSDWFWWYGDDHSSDHDVEFDDLFRRHLRNAYRLLDRPVPDELFVSNISVGAVPPVVSEPTASLAPVIDGRETSYFEWLGAGDAEVRDVAGAMHQVDRAAPLVRRIRYGCGQHRLYVRLDGDQPLGDYLAAGYEFSLKFLVPDAIRLSVRIEDSRLTTTIWDRRPDPPHWFQRNALSTAAAAAETIIEIALPFAEIGAGASVSFFVAVYDRLSAEIERHPARRPIDVARSDDRFEALNWTA